MCRVRVLVRCPRLVQTTGDSWQFPWKPPNLIPKMLAMLPSAHAYVQCIWRWHFMVLVSSSHIPFRQIYCHGLNCRRLFFICSSCYRNHRYCSKACRELADIENRRAARRRYRLSPEGQANGRDLQRKYRLRIADLARAEAQKTVMDNTPNPRLTSGIIASPPVTAPCEAQRRPFLSLFGQIVCHFCGRIGHFLNPFIESG